MHDVRFLYLLDSARHLSLLLLLWVFSLNDTKFLKPANPNSSLSYTTIPKMATIAYPKLTTLLPISFSSVRRTHENKKTGIVKYSLALAKARRNNFWCIAQPCIWQLDEGGTPPPPVQPKSCSLVTTANFFTHCQPETTIW